MITHHFHSAFFLKIPFSKLCTMTAIYNSCAISKCNLLHYPPGSSVKSADRLGSTNLPFSFKGTRKSSAQRGALIVQASFSYGGRSSGGSAFVSGFVIGGLIVGTLGCVYAPQISKALTGTDKKDLMKKLPKFIYDEDKALEKQRKKLSEKINQLDSAIDNVSTQLRTEEATNEEEAVSVDDVEAASNWAS